MPKKIADIVSEIPGNIPFILTVRDDGYFNTLDGANLLPLAKHPRSNDTGTRELGSLITNWGLVFYPFLMLQNIERKRMTNIIRLYFYECVSERVKKCLARWGKCYVIDLHATEKQPSFGEFDIIFGTNNRKTVINDFDICFSTALKEGKSLKVYVPKAEEIPGEIWKASMDSTLVNWVKKKSRESRPSRWKSPRSGFLTKRK